MISILLAAYNGEKYITDLIESILAQTCQDFRLYIRDDKSTDSTYYIITEYEMKNPGKIFTERNEENTGGAHHNFLKMTIDHKDDYVMLCDQDDVWLPEKIEKSLSKIKEMEQEYGTSTPVLIHTDLKVTDENLNVISESYRQMANISFKYNALNNLLAMNILTGHTMMYNRALADLIVSEPDYFVMHDWWLSLIGAAFGKIAALEEPTSLHRQHLDNSVGAKKALSPQYIKYVLTHIEVMAEKLSNSYKQAWSFLKLYGDNLTEEQKELVAAHAAMPILTKKEKLRTMIRNKTFLYGIARKTAQVIVLLRSKEI